jgi:hypothetical protein
MFKPLTRSPKTPHRPNAGFAETQFLHTADDDDYSGFAPTQMSDEHDLAADEAPAAPAPSPAATRAAASTSHTALERAAEAAAAGAPPEQPSIPQSWVTSQWVAAQEAKAHEAANHARAVIAAQRGAEEQAATGGVVAEAAAPRTGLARLRAAFERLLPGGLLPLFVGVTATMSLISAALPLFARH